ncbi:MAG: Hpt domain-containing protein [Myxococcota bacterium]
MQSILNVEEALERLDGDHELYAEVLQLFMEDTPKLLDALKLEVRGHSSREATRLAHSIKSAAANVGASEVARLAAQCELAGKNDRWEELPQLVFGLDEAMSMLMGTAHHWLDQHPL